MERDVRYLQKMVQSAAAKAASAVHGSRPCSSAGDGAVADVSTVAPAPESEARPSGAQVYSRFRKLAVEMHKQARLGKGPAR